MINKELVLELKNQGFGFQQIALQTGVTRQRIHQIIMKYKNTGKRSRKNKYRNMGKCENCNNNAVLLHHKDFNNLNDDMSNLEKLCHKCHYKKHKGRKHINFIKKAPIKPKKYKLIKLSPGKQKRYTFILDERTFKRLNIEATKKNVSNGNLVRYILETFFKKI